jgi:sugar phosphate isomerase/epimerase
MLFAGHDRESTLASIAALGFPAVDIWASGFLGSEDAVGVPDLARHADPEVDDPDALRAELAGHGLRLHALSIYRSDLAAKLRRIDFAAALGAECVIFCAERTALERFAEETVAPVVERCEARGVRLAIENHIDRAVDTIDSMVRLIERFPSPSFGYALAPPHLEAIGESPAEAVRIVGAERLHSVYVWDLARGYERADSINFGPGEEQMPGGGRINFASLDAALDEAGYRGRLNLGVHGTTRWPIGKIEREIRGSLRLIERDMARACSARLLAL